MKIYHILLFVTMIFSTSTSAQQIELFGGINSNHLLDNISSDDTNYSSTLESGRGYTIGFSFDNPNMNGFASRISLSYNKIKGKISTGYLDPNLSDSGSYTQANIEKNSFNIAVYPFTFIVQNIYFGFGLQANLTMSNSTTGDYGPITIAGPEGRDISNNDSLHKDLGYGVTMRVHYNIMLNNGLSIVPQYNLYYGMSEEYSTAESEKIKVWQQVLALGIAMQF